MILFPAIDLKDNEAVRLFKGDFNKKTVYSKNPEEIAKDFEKAGAKYLHLVDLDGAKSGNRINEKAIKKILSTVSLKVQLGGGIRSEEAIKDALNLGVERVILGTIAQKDPAFVKSAIEKFGADKIVVGIDAKEECVAVSGWEDVSNTNLFSLAIEMKKVGVKTIIYTDISKDGTLAGVNVLATKTLSEKTDLNVIASGGVSSMNDLEKLSRENIYGAIIGKAYYEKKLDLSLAIERFSNV